jgi:microcystin degradation protein MlrC
MSGSGTHGSVTIHNRAKGKYRPDGHTLRISVENLNSVLGDDVKTLDVAYGRSVTVQLASKTVKFKITSISTRRQNFKPVQWSTVFGLAKQHINLYVVESSQRFGLDVSTTHLSGDDDSSSDDDL